MDIVYVCRDGENPELRYSLRTLQNVNHDRVWVFGGAPRWLNTGTVNYVRRRQDATPAHSTRGHIMAACKTPGVSDPFMLWNDDFYAMKKIGDVPIYHRGLLVDHVERMTGYHTPWSKGLRITADLLEKQGMLDGALSYSIHLPLIVHKAEMLEAIDVARKTNAQHFHLRTLYGAMANLGGDKYIDPKVLRRSDPFPRGPWLSSSPDSFRHSVEPVLRYTFPGASPYEKD